MVVTIHDNCCQSNGAFLENIIRFQILLAECLEFHLVDGNHVSMESGRGRRCALAIVLRIFVDNKLFLIANL